MIDWEEIIKAESADELKEAKLWLFHENVRLEKERKELLQAQDKFFKEQGRMRNELDALNRHTIMERKRLREENLFFEQKMAILQDGFRKLEEDRRRLDKEKRSMVEEKVKLQKGQEDKLSETNVAEILFRNAGNPLALKKRYRDLIKIFHPDNLFGDAELAGVINKEFVRRKRDDL